MPYFATEYMECHILVPIVCESVAVQAGIQACNLSCRMYIYLLLLILPRQSNAVITHIETTNLHVFHPHIPSKIPHVRYQKMALPKPPYVRETYEEAFLELGDEPPLAGIMGIDIEISAYEDSKIEARAAIESFIARVTNIESIYLGFKK